MGLQRRQHVYSLLYSKVFGAKEKLDSGRRLKFHYGLWLTKKYGVETVNYLSYWFYLIKTLHAVSVQLLLTMPYVRRRFFSVSKSGTFLFSIVILLLSGTSPARRTLVKKWLSHFYKKISKFFDVHATKVFLIYI